MSKTHKVFISFHHANDESRKKIFELRFGNKFGKLISGAVSYGDIDTDLKTETIRQKIRDEYLRDTSVTVVLIGSHTWQRKHVDWEIASSIRDTVANPRSGLLGILLPDYHRHHGVPLGEYQKHTIPPRLADNIEVGFASIHEWSEDPDIVQEWIHQAWLRKARVIPTNARDLFKKNRTADRWE